MSDSTGKGDQNKTPDDVATLYSWANLHGAKYRDFSASRAVIRETARLRVQEATEAERQRIDAPRQAELVADTDRAAEAERAEVAERAAEAERAADTERAAAAQRAAEAERAATAQRAAEAEHAAAAQRAAEAESAAEAKRAADWAEWTAHQAAQQDAQLAAEQAAAVQRAAEAERAADAKRAADWAEWTAHQAAQRDAHAAAEQAAQREAQLAAQEAERRAAFEAAQREEERQFEIEAARLAAQAAEQKAAREAAQRAAEAAEHEAAQQAARFAFEAAERRAAQEAAQRAAEAAQYQAAQEAARVAYEAAEQRAAQEAAQRAALEAEHQAAQQAARLATEAAEQRATQLAAQLAEAQAAHRAAQEALKQQVSEQHTPAIPAPNPAPLTPPYDPAPPRPPFQRLEYPGYERPTQVYVPPPQQGAFGSQSQPSAQTPIPPPIQPQFHPPVQAPVQAPVEAAEEETTDQPRACWPPADSRETPGRPAWLMPERMEIPAQPPAATPASAAPQVPADTLQSSRDRLASRWYALRGVFSPGPAPVETAPTPAASRAPVMAIFSLAGGVGKTSLVATLGRALAARGERVLLVDTAAYGLLPFFFGARDQRPGMLRTFSPPGVNNDAPIQMVTIDPEALGPEPASAEANGQNGLSAEIARFARAGVSRVIIDLATASGATTRRVMRMAPMILVPVLPDMNSVVSVSSIDDFFEHNSASGIKAPLYYVMNQFDPSLPLHLDIREVLREQLGDRLLPFALRRTPSVSEALAEGMTVMDYAPNSGVAEDFGALAGWVKSLSAPASTTYRGVRWSER